MAPPVADILSGILFPANSHGGQNTLKAQVLYNRSKHLCHVISQAKQTESKIFVQNQVLPSQSEINIGRYGLCGFFDATDKTFAGFGRDAGEIHHDLHALLPRPLFRTSLRYGSKSRSLKVQGLRLCEEDSCLPVHMPSQQCRSASAIPPERFDLLDFFCS